MWIECIPNFSEGKDRKVLENILAAAEAAGARVLGMEGDVDHNRSVMTLAGDGEVVLEAVFRAAVVAVRDIDLTRQSGTHPRLGALDVVPFVPLGTTPMAYAVDLATRFGRRVGEELQVPVYLYEQAASRPEKRNLADVRRGEFEGLATRMLTDPPDFGPQTPHSTAGAMAVGARFPLVAFNVFLTTADLDIARSVARAVRGSSGGLIGLKALAMDTVHHGRVQVSLNLVDYPTTPLPAAIEMVRREAARYGVSIAETELIGLMPAQAMIDSLRYYLQLPTFKAEQIVELALAGSEFTPQPKIPPGHHS